MAKESIIKILLDITKNFKKWIKFEV